MTLVDDLNKALERIDRLERVVAKLLRPGGRQGYICINEDNAALSSAQTLAVGGSNPNASTGIVQIGISALPGDIVTVQSCLRAAAAAGSGGYLRIQLYVVDPTATSNLLESFDTVLNAGLGNGEDKTVSYVWNRYICTAKGTYTFQIFAATAFSTGTVIINTNSSTMSLQVIAPGS